MHDRHEVVNAYCQYVATNREAFSFVFTQFTHDHEMMHEIMIYKIKNENLVIIIKNVRSSLEVILVKGRGRLIPLPVRNT
jgi:hypothetical protein